MEVVLLDSENIEPFESFMGGVNAAAVCFDNDTFGMGLLHNQEVYGEVVIRINGTEAVIRSLYIVPEHRREGGATVLLLEASAYAGMNETVDGFSVEFTEDLIADNGLKAFFEYCGFDLTENTDVQTYSLTLKDLMESPYLKGNSTVHGQKTYAQLSHDERHSLLEEPPFYMPMYVQGNLIEPDVSVFLTEKGALQGCIVVVPEDDALSVVWMRIAPTNYKELIVMLKNAGNAALEKYGPDKQVILPIISKEANLLVNKLFGNSLVKIEKSYTGIMMFEEDGYME